ncbi:unnamed protein product [Cuscuta epithymum]|uniref:DSBA-like thioredoxin domain-containing protein n=1 Tax=Cuscuta epithymum TaxID=186058 RepID=A0AAV0DK20_9ASTE|nr:unnamed protein product [Cuscuta epithymum]
MPIEITGHLRFLYPQKLQRFMAQSSAADSIGKKKKLIHIDISSDSVCPWCFVGKRNLDTVIASSKEHYEFEIKWHPYLLNPSAPKEGVSKKEFYMQKFGTLRDFQRSWTGI